MAALSDLAGIKMMHHVPIFKKVPADSVPFGTDICTHGHSVWIACDPDEPDKIVATAASAREARAKYRRIKSGTYGRSPARTPTYKPRQPGWGHSAPTAGVG